MLSRMQCVVCGEILSQPNFFFLQFLVIIVLSFIWEGGSWKLFDYQKWILSRKSLRNAVSEAACYLRSQVVSLTFYPYDCSLVCRLYV